MIIYLYILGTLCIPLYNQKIIQYFYSLMSEYVKKHRVMWSKIVKLKKKLPIVNIKGDSKQEVQTSSEKGEIHLDDSESHSNAGFKMP